MILSIFVFVDIVFFRITISCNRVLLLIIITLHLRLTELITNSWQIKERFNHEKY